MFSLKYISKVNALEGDAHVSALLGNDLAAAELYAEATKVHFENKNFVRTCQCVMNTSEYLSRLGMFEDVFDGIRLFSTFFIKNKMSSLAFELSTLLNRISSRYPQSMPDTSSFQKYVRECYIKENR